MRALGIPLHVLADALDVTVQSARARAGTDGPIRLDDFRRLIGPSVARTDGRGASHGQTLHPASTLIVAFLESITPSEGGGTLPR
ncbi:hypothetical protein ELQ93_10605 [Labedella gwakjiensis]|nr:hypothetical protein ELQ93_10605 [Labedella gwakjiensis]